MDFNNVSQSLLLHKLNNYRIKGIVNSRIKSISTNRTKAVVTDGAKSTYLLVESEVPHGILKQKLTFQCFNNE